VTANTIRKEIEKRNKEIKEKQEYYSAFVRKELPINKPTESKATKNKATLGQSFFIYTLPSCFYLTKPPLTSTSPSLNAQTRVVCMSFFL